MTDKSDHFFKPQKENLVQAAYMAVEEDTEVGECSLVIQKKEEELGNVSGLV